MIFQTVSVASTQPAPVYRFVWTATAAYVAVIEFATRGGSEVRVIKREAARQEFNDLLAAGATVLQSFGVRTCDSDKMVLREEMAQALGMLDRLP